MHYVSTELSERPFLSGQFREYINCLVQGQLQSHAIAEPHIVIRDQLLHPQHLAIDVAEAANQKAHLVQFDDEIGRALLGGIGQELEHSTI